MMKKVLITGGNGGIATAIREALAASGDYEFFTPDIEDMDVTKIDSVESYFEKIKPDVLVNCAGYLNMTTAKGANLAKEKLAIDINLFGTFNCTTAAVNNNPEVVVINLGSGAATRAIPEWSSYCATKAAVVMATACWALEGVKTVCLSPVKTATAMRTDAFPDEDKKTLLTPAQVARVAVKAINGEYAYGSNINITFDNADTV